MNFILKCPTSRFHGDFWTTVPVTTSWSMIHGRLQLSDTGKVWDPNEKDEWFCHECGEAAIVEEL